MGVSSFGEDLIIKARKPYTVTKPRERWTEEEHNRFLEALKLYGRAWQRIEEHIGTKTAVQIRSHAQKFFTKLEKEALVKGLPLGHAYDIDIPPPRPKRKPANPYPRKNGIGAPVSPTVGAQDENLVTSVSSLHHSKQELGLEDEPPVEEPRETENFQTLKESQDEGNCSEVNPFREIPNASVSSASKTSVSTIMALTNTCTYGKFMHPTKEKNDHSETDESSLTVEPKGNFYLHQARTSFTKVVPGEGANELKHPEKLGSLSSNETQAAQSYPRHVPVHVVDRSDDKCIQIPSVQTTVPTSIIPPSGALGDCFANSAVSETMSVPTSVIPPSGFHGNCFSNSTASETAEPHTDSARPCIHQPLPVFYPPFIPFSNIQDAYGNFLNIPAALSSLIISTLLQNPAALTAAKLAASFLPCLDDASTDSHVAGFPASHVNASPSLAVIAAATVAAASAWWASHGFLPFCPPFHTGFLSTPVPATTMATTATTQSPTDASKERIEDSPQGPAPQDLQILDPDLSIGLKMQSPSCKSPSLLLSDSEESGGEGSNIADQKAASHEKSAVSCIILHSSDNGKTRKMMDRSSCGSNTPSGSDVETDALEKHMKGKEAPGEAELSHQMGEPINRRCRSAGNVNDSRKVSEEGRLAFQALFSREVLPQSFSRHGLKNKAWTNGSVEEGNQKSSKDGDAALEMDLSSKTQATFNHSQFIQMDELLQNDNTTKGLPLNGLIGHGKLKARRTGFKPYKRCSMEARDVKMLDSSSSQREENDAKRIRLEGESST